MLLKIGERLFTAHGYRDVSVEIICQEAGIATGSFYNYFPSKEAFYARILHALEARGMELADRVVSRLKSPLNQLKALYRFVTLGMRRNRLLKGILTGDRRYTFPGWTEFSSPDSVLHRHLESLLDGIIKEGTRQRVFRSGRYRDPTRMITAVLDTILTRLDVEGSEVLLNDVLTLLERGLKRTLRLTGWEERRDRLRRRRRRKLPEVGTDLEIS